METLAPAPACRHSRIRVEDAPPDRVHRPSDRIDASVSATGIRDGLFEVRAKKVGADSVGNETEAPMDDFVEIGVFAPGESDDLGEPLYLERHRTRGGRQTIRITVPREPDRAGINPYHKLIDREGGDNVVEPGSRGAGVTIRS